jgi:hypothetical protein
MSQDVTQVATYVTKLSQLSQYIHMMSQNVINCHKCLKCHRMSQTSQMSQNLTIVSTVSTVLNGHKILEICGFFHIFLSFKKMYQRLDFIEIIFIFFEIFHENAQRSGSFRGVLVICCLQSNNFHCFFHRFLSLKKCTKDWIVLFWLPRQHQVQQGVPRVMGHPVTTNVMTS